MNERLNLSVNWEEINRNIDNIELRAQRSANSYGEELDLYSHTRKVLISAESNSCIGENRFSISGSGELKFSELCSCLGIILVDQEKKVALVVHVTPIIDDDIEKICNNYLEQIDDIYKINVTRMVLVSSQLGEHSYHKIMEELIKKKYGVNDVEHYKELTVSYDIDSDTITKAKVVYPGLFEP